MAEVTALRRAAPGRVAIEVDGRPWRTVPDDVVVAARLTAGVELDRATLRLIRAGLVRARAVGVAGRALARRDLSRGEVAARLERARVHREDADRVVDSLASAGLVDDARVARTRAAALAGRGWGDAAIAARLEAAGVSASVTREALDALEPEADRARGLLEGDGDRRRSLKRLATRGFSAETLEEVAGALDWGV